MSKQTLTVATPEADRDDATHLAVALGWIEGWTPQEWEHCFTAQYQDAQGGLYRIMSMPVKQSFIDHAVGMGPIDRPPQDVGTLDPDTGEYGPPYVINLAGAHRAQAKLVIWQPAQPDPETGDVPDNPVPQVGSGKLIAVVGMKGTAALTAMGLQSIPVDI